MPGVVLPNAVFRADATPALCKAVWSGKCLLLLTLIGGQSLPVFPQNFKPQITGPRVGTCQARLAQGSKSEVVWTVMFYRILSACRPY
jgi:hypothetical protein